MKDAVIKILTGACYGFCAIMLMKGTIVKPLLLSQFLGVITTVLAVLKVYNDIPHIWTALGFVAGGIASWFLKLM